VIRTLVFDLGNVLVYFSHRKMCAQIGALCNRSSESIDDVLFQSDLQANFERGRVTEDQFHQQLEQSVGQRMDKGDLLQACSEIFEINLSILPVLDTLMVRGYRLVLLSNVCVTHFEYVQNHFDVLNRFDEYVVSYQIGAVKPEPEIFEAILHAIKCDPNECFYTDDVAEYVHTGLSYGLQAEVFCNTDTLIHQLGEHRILLDSDADMVN